MLVVTTTIVSHKQNVYALSSHTEENKQAQTSRMAIRLTRHVPADIQMLTVMGGLMDTLPHGII